MGIEMDLVENHPLLRFNDVLKDCDTTGSRVGSCLMRDPIMLPIAAVRCSNILSGGFWFHGWILLDFIQSYNENPWLRLESDSEARIQVKPASEKLKDISTNRSSRFNDHLLLP